MTKAIRMIASAAAIPRSAGCRMSPGMVGIPIIHERFRAAAGTR
jgi:hypothetical protein